MVTSQISDAFYVTALYLGGPLSPPLAARRDCSLDSAAVEVVQVRRSFLCSKKKKQDLPCFIYGLLLVLLCSRKIWVYQLDDGRSKLSLRFECWVKWVFYHYFLPLEAFLLKKYFWTQDDRRRMYTKQFWGTTIVHCKKRFVGFWCFNLKKNK